MKLLKLCNCLFKYYQWYNFAVLSLYHKRKLATLYVNWTLPHKIIDWLIFPSHLKLDSLASGCILEQKSTLTSFGLFLQISLNSPGYWPPPARDFQQQKILMLIIYTKKLGEGGMPGLLTHHLYLFCSHSRTKKGRLSLGEGIQCIIAYENSYKVHWAWSHRDSKLKCSSRGINNFSV